MDIKQMFKHYIECFNNNNIEELTLAKEALEKMGYFVLLDGKWFRLLPVSSGYSRSEFKQATIAKEALKRG